MIDRDAYLMEEEFPGQKNISIQSEIILSRIDKEIRHKRYVRMARFNGSHCCSFCRFAWFRLYLNSLVDLFGNLTMPKFIFLKAKVQEFFSGR